MFKQKLINPLSLFTKSSVSIIAIGLSPPQELLSLTGWTDTLGHVDFLVPDGPLSTRSRADESTYAALAQRGVYDASERQRCWGLFRLLGLGVPPDAPDWSVTT